MSKCDDWQNWDSLSPEEKEQFLNDLIADAADQFGIPAPEVNYGDVGGALGKYNPNTGITIDPAADNGCGYAQFDDAALAAETAFHETVHAAQDFYYPENTDLSGPEAQGEAANLAKEMVEELNDECGPPPYPGEGGGGNGEGGGNGGSCGLPTTVEGWDEARGGVPEELPFDLILF